MSTRSVVAAPTGEVTWAGRFCHWDGYPSSNGAFVWQAVTEHFKGDVAAAIEFFVKPDQGEEAGYWSSLTSAFDPEPPKTEPCELCGATGVRSDELGVQWGQDKKVWKDAEGVEHVGWCNGCSGTGQRPYMGSHGWVNGNGGGWVTSDGDDGGTEYAYVLREDRLQVFERREGGARAVGMFGMNAADRGEWAIIGSYPWDGATPPFVVVEDEPEDTSMDAEASAS